MLHNFSWAACFSSSCLFVCHNHRLCSWLLDNLQMCWLARSPDTCAKTTGRIELQFGVLIGLGQCHFVLDGCPIPNRPSVTFPGEDHSWLLNIFVALYLTNGSSRRMVKIEQYTVLRAPSTSYCKQTVTSRPAASTRVLARTRLQKLLQ